jgi:hypothetical protein
MDYKLWMTEAMGRLMKPAKPVFAPNRAGRRAALRSTQKRGKGFTK